MGIYFFITKSPLSGLIDQLLSVERGSSAEREYKKVPTQMGLPYTLTFLDDEVVLS